MRIDTLPLKRKSRGETLGKTQTMRTERDPHK